MAALDFPTAPTSGQQYAAPNGVMYAWDGTVWLARSTYPPTGVAGGDLTGSYPNPTIVAGAVGTAEISDVAYSKVTGAPTSLPPSGAASGSLAGTYPAPTLTTTGVAAGTYGTAAKIPRVTLTAEGRVSAVTELDVAPTGGSPSGPAGGDLSGTYPNPQLAAGAIVDADVSATAAIQYSKLAGVPTALPPSGTASGDLGGSYPGPTVVKAQAGFVVGASLLTVRSSDGAVLLPGAAAADAQLIVGARTIKGRLLTLSGLDFAALTFNYARPAAQDDVTKASWRVSLRLDSDDFAVERSPAGSVTMARVAIVSAVGDFFITGSVGMKTTGTTWANPSDRRLKDAIADYRTGLAAILQLQPRTFVYNGQGGSLAGVRGYGFIADEVAPVMPETVGVRRGKLDPADAAETDIQTLDQSNLILALVNAVKELSARVVALEAAVAAAPAP